MVKLYSLFKTPDPENHTLSSGTYPFRPNEGVSPGGVTFASKSEIIRSSKPFSLGNKF